MKLVFLPSTRSDLLWIRTYYAHVFPDGVKRAAKQYGKVCGIIRNNPFVGHTVEEIEKVREFSIPQTPFPFIYRVIDDRIEVLRVWDQRNDRSRLKSE